LHGYDTLTGAWRQLLPGVRWDGEKRLERGDRVTVTRWKTGESVTLEEARATGGGDGYDFAEVRFSASLPKVLYGSNAGVVVRERAEVAAALDEVRRVVCELAGNELNVWSAELRRLDVTADRDLGDEVRVTAALRRLSGLPLRGRYPVRGEDGSVTWRRKKGAVTRRVYSKYRETGDPSVSGLLRAESQLTGQRLIRHLLRWRSSVTVRASDLLTEEGEAMRDRVGESLGELIEPFAKEVEDVKLYEAFKTFRGHFRSDRAASLVGWAMLVRAFGWESLEPFLSRQSIWKLRRDLQTAGVDPQELEWEEGEGEPYLAAGDAEVQPIGPLRTLLLEDGDDEEE
jgi:hypothetical protein